MWCQVSEFETLHFSIDGEWLTERVRDLWVEEEFEKAFEILDCMIGLRDESKELICIGKKKMVGVNSVNVVDDDVTEHLGIPLRPMRETLHMLKQREAEARQRRQDEDAATLVMYENTGYCVVGSPWGRLKAPSHVCKRIPGRAGMCLKISFGEFERRFPGLVELAKEEAITSCEFWANRNKQLDKQAARESKKTVAEVAEELVPGSGALYESIDKPERGTCKDRNGWLLPDGKFYKCKYYQHDALADALGKEVSEIESKWIRVQHPADVKLPMAISGGPFNFGTRRRPPTKRQVTFMWDYCQHHDIPYTWTQEQIEGLSG